jgi:hypothetical protein
MKRETIFLKIVVFLIGIPIAALCIIGLPSIMKEALDFFPNNSLYPVFIGLYVAAIPYFIALYQALRLLSYIDQQKAFSELSVRALKTIKFCAVTIFAVFSIELPFLYILAQFDDAPGIMAIGLVIAAASLVIAVFAAVLQKLLKNAIDIKSENDLTV